MGKVSSEWYTHTLIYGIHHRQNLSVERRYEQLSSDIRAKMHVLTYHNAYICAAMAVERYVSGCVGTSIGRISCSNRT